MSPSISPPAPDVLADLMATHAHRFPEKAHIPVPGDGGAVVNLPIVIGIPTGAAKMPEGRPVSSQWSLLVGSALGFLGDDAGDDDAFVRDCLLYPSPAIWAAWCDYWAALTTPALKLIKRKIGYHVDCYQALVAGAPTPEGLKVSPRGMVRILRPRAGLERPIAVEPPEASAWRLYLRAAKAPGADIGKWTREIVDEVTANAAPEVLDQYPGLVILLARGAAQLAGAGAEGQLGNW